MSVDQALQYYYCLIKASNLVINIFIPSTKGNGNRTTVQQQLDVLEENRTTVQQQLYVLEENRTTV